MKREARNVAARAADAAPSRRPRSTSLPSAHAASSMTRQPVALARCSSSGAEVARHAHLVHAQDRLRLAGRGSPRHGSGSMLQPPGSMSTNTGTAPQYRIALAVATYEWLTVTTSSPGPTPTARSARWSAVVQLDTAQACAVPTAGANSSSKAATSGPCVTQPDRIARRAASASRLVRAAGAAIGISGSAPLGNGRLPGPTPPVDEVAQPLLEADRCASKPSSRRACSTSASRRADSGCTAAADACSTPTSEPITASSSSASSSRLVSTPLPTLNTSPEAADARGEHVRARDVLDVDEVHRCPSRRRRSTGGRPAAIRSIQRTSTSV